MDTNSQLHVKHLVATVAGSVLLCFTTASHASLTSLNSPFGVDTITYDSGTGLEWLDLTVTANQSFNSVSALLGTTYAGFRYATKDEVGQLFANAGISGNSGDGHADVVAAKSLMGLWGTLYNLVETRFADIQSLAIVTVPGYSSAIEVPLATLRVVTTSMTENFSAFPYGGGMGVSTADSVHGSALVRNHVAAVPEPETYAMFLAGLGLLGAAAKRRARA